MIKRPSLLLALKVKARSADERKLYAEALETWKRAASRGDAEAVYQVGLHYEAGIGVQSNLVEAVLWHKRAANLAYSRAYARLGSIYLTGGSTAGPNPASGTLSKLFPDGVKVAADAAEAFSWNLKAAESGEGSSQVLLALQFASGLGTAIDYSAAEHWFRSAADQGESAGHFGLGKLYAGGQLGEPNNECAIQEFRYAANENHVQAKVFLAVLLIGRGDQRSTSEALELLQDAAEQDSIDAIYLLGRANALGQGKTADLSLAEMWFRRAVVKGHMLSGVALAQLLLRRPVPDYVSAAELLSQAAERGNATAQFELAKLCRAGLGVRKDNKRAVQLFERAADQGVMAAQEDLGAAYADKFSTVANPELAREWFLKAADSGSFTALFHVGVLTEATNPGDVEETVAAYRKAVDQGSAAAALRLGVLYASGDLVDQDYARAAFWYESAVVLGSLTAHWNLAFLYIRGLGVDKDVEKGLSILRSAALAGHLFAAQSLEALFSAGLYVEPDPGQAHTWRLKAAELGDGRAASELVMALDSEAPSAKGQKCIHLLIRLAEANDPYAQSTLGRIAYEGRLVPKDISFSLHWLTKAAEKGDAFAQAWLGDVLISGQGISEDREKALDWYWRSANVGHAGAALILTDLALKGHPNVAPHQIFDFWRRSAETGSALGQRMSGDFLLRGFGTSQDVIRGIAYLRSAADAGNTAAQSLLAVTLLNYPENKAFDHEPVVLLRLAADAGNVEAQYNLGVCYRRGLSIKADRDQAEYWYRRAVDAEHPSAELALADLLLEAMPGDVENVDEIVDLYEKAYRHGSPGGAYGLAHMHERGLLKGSSNTEAIKLYAAAAEIGHRLSRLRLEALVAEHS